MLAEIETDLQGARALASWIRRVRFRGPGTRWLPETPKGLGDMG
jgi:hypothetical protein